MRATPGIPGGFPRIFGRRRPFSTSSARVRPRYGLSTPTGGAGPEPPLPRQYGAMTFRYDFAPTPFGDALAVFSDEGIVRFDLSESEDPSVPWLLESVSRQLHAVPEPDPGAADELSALLDQYFEGTPIRFDDSIRLDWRLVDGFHRRALETIRTIEWGQTMSYGEVAVVAGHPGAARAVGSACRITPFSIIVPVHRVVKSDGSPGHYGAHPERKRFLLDLESS